MGLGTYKFPALPDGLKTGEPAVPAGSPVPTIWYEKGQERLTPC
jgi:hypothetical protein